MWLLILSGLLAAREPWEFVVRNTEIYKPCVYGSALRIEGEYFVFSDTSNHRLLFVRDGETIRTVGRLGSGPGDLHYPTKLQVLNDRLYVTELSHISVFSLDGIYEDKIQPPRHIALNKTVSGWVSVLRSDESLETILHDEHFSKATTLFAAQSPINREHFNPAPPVSFSLIDRKGLYSYVSQPSRFLIKVFDNATGELVREIQKKRDPLPFDQEWGKQQARDFNRRSRMTTGHTPREASFPSHFPPIKRMLTDIDNRLLVFTYDNKVFAFDEQGNEVKPRFSSIEINRRVLGVEGQSAYVISFIEEEANVVKVPIDQVPWFVKKFPNR